MGLGVFALIVVLSVMNGFDHELKQRILRVIPHGYVTMTKGKLDDWQGLAAELKGWPDLVASAPFVSGQGLIAFGGTVRGIEIQGIQPEYEEKLSPIEEAMLAGSLADLQPGEYGIVLGRLAAQFLGLTLGDKVSVTLPVVSVTPAGIFPRTKRFQVVGVFEVNAPIDQTLTMIHLHDAQKLFRTGDAVDGLHLGFTDIYQAPDAMKNIGVQLGTDYKVLDWSQTQGNLFQAVKMEKTMTGVMLSIIVAVAAFNIITSLIMMVSEKRSDIAVLRTMGLRRGDIIKIFMVQGTTMGCTGIVVGAALGVFTAINLSGIVAFVEKSFGVQFFDPDVFFVSFLPSVWQWQDTVVVCVGAFLVCILATIYPAIKAAKIEPAEALRYDT